MGLVPIAEDYPEEDTVVDIVRRSLHLVAIRLKHEQIIVVTAVSVDQDDTYHTWAFVLRMVDKVAVGLALS